MGRDLLYARMHDRGWRGMGHLLIDEDEAEHGPTQAPLVGAVIEENNLKERLQDLRSAAATNKD